MFMNKCKVLFALVLGVAASSIGLLPRPLVVTPPPVAAAGSGEKNPPPKGDQENLRGTWEVVELVTGGAKVMPAAGLKGKVLVEGDTFRFVLTPEGMDDITRTVATLKLDPSKSPRAVDATLTEGTGKGKVLLGIYRLDGDDLMLCLNQDHADDRPTQFKAEKNERVLFKLKRSKK